MWLVIFLISCAIKNVFAANILGVFVIPSISHQAMFQQIYRELAVKGHNVTIITPDPIYEPALKNLREIDLHDVSYEMWNKFDISSWGTDEDNDSSNISPFVNMMIELMDMQMDQEEVKQFRLEDLTIYDVLLVERVVPTAMAFKTLCKCPLISLFSLPASPFIHSILGNPAHPIVNPDVNLPFSRDLTYIERVKSVSSQIMLKWIMMGFQQLMDDTARKHFDDLPSVSEMMMDVDLVISNVNTAIYPPRPNVPMVIEVSGIHIKSPKPLPEDLKLYLDNAKNGVVYISFGSNIRAHKFPKPKIKIILDTIAELPYDFIWKFETDELKDAPKNLLLSKWLPQQDLLRHPNIKLFVTQGGLQSFEESLYAKVPMLVIPFFGDQLGNARKISEAGMGISLNFVKLTKHDLKIHIEEIINNRTYKLTTEKLYEITVDKPMNGLDTAVWWIEYIIRHQTGQHLRSAAFKMPFYKYYLLDVIALYLLIAAVVIYIIITAIRLLALCIKRLKSKSKLD